MSDEIIFFSQYKLGGVQNYYRQIIANDKAGRFRKKWILTQDKSDPAALPPAPFGVTDEQVFEYNSADEETARKLAKLIPRGPGLIMTNFHLELNALRNHYHGDKTIVHVCHDDFFLDIARDYAHIIDAFVAHNYAYYTKLTELFPGRKKDVYFLPYGIELSPFQRTHSGDGVLKVFFLARFDKKKGVYDLFAIDEVLKKRNIKVEWMLVGDGPEKEKLQNLVAAQSNFSLKTLPDTTAIFEEAARHDVFILPSYLDGLPVALLETMSAGLVPVISAFNEGIQKVVDDTIGYIVPVGDVNAFADKLAYLDQHRSVLAEKGTHAKERVLKEYNIVERAADYYRFFGMFKELKKTAWYKYRHHRGNNILSYSRYRLAKVLRAS